MPHNKTRITAHGEAAARRFFHIHDALSYSLSGRKGVTGMAKVLKMQFNNTSGNGATFEVVVDNPKDEVTLAMVREVAPYIGKVMGAGDATFKKAWFETVQIEALT